MATKEDWHYHFLAMPTYKLVHEWAKHPSLHESGFGRDSFFAALTREQMIESLTLLMFNLSAELPAHPPHQYWQNMVNACAE